MREGEAMISWVGIPVVPNFLESIWEVTYTLYI